MDRFSKLHPLMQLLFFVAIFALVLSLNNPLFSAVSLICALLYGVKIRGREIIGSIKFVALVMLAVSVFNMLFAHYGEHILFTIKSIDFTLETLLYGFNQGMVLAAVMLWFGAFSRITDSDRVIYLLRFAPKTALIFSMVLGFIPRFTKKLKDIQEARLALNGADLPNGFKEKLKVATANLSALVTYSLESSIITANSMEARGYNPKAVRAGRYKFAAGDIILIALIAISTTVVACETVLGKSDFSFNPNIQITAFSIYAFLSFIVLNLLPLAVDLVEDVLWKISLVKN